MDAMDLDTDLERLMRRWHHTTEYATAAWAEYQALRDALPARHHRVTLRSCRLAGGRARAAGAHEGDRAAGGGRGGLVNECTFKIIS